MLNIISKKTDDGVVAEIIWDGKIIHKFCVFNGCDFTSNLERVAEQLMVVRAVFSSMSKISYKDMRKNILSIVNDDE